MQNPPNTKCRDCGREQFVHSGSWVLVAPPRCPACGGMLDSYFVVHARFPLRTSKKGQRPHAANRGARVSLRG